MTDITELAQREKFEAWAEECNALPWGYLKKLRIYTGFYSDHTYTSLWAAWKAAGAELVEALEKARQRIAELEDAEQKLCAANVTLDARAELAERQLESRTVKLPESFYPDGDIDCPPVMEMADVIKALAAQGIKVEAE
ncbi:hypothetical protein D9D10_03655 [Raoultella ornithinolytica]|nr:hypothetical protein D9D10_03655 [Raoultella ornithinolytica]